MKSCLYIFTATALVSLPPFLALFNPECYPGTHGIFSDGILLILMLFSYLKEKCKDAPQKILIYIIAYITTALISFVDLHSITRLLQINMGVYILLPLITPALALLLLKNIKPLELRHINLALFATLFLHLVTMNTELGIPLLSFILL